MPPTDERAFKTERRYRFLAESFNTAALIRKKLFQSVKVIKPGTKLE